MNVYTFSGDFCANVNTFSGDFCVNINTFSGDFCAKLDFLLIIPKNCDFFIWGFLGGRNVLFLWGDFLGIL